MRFNEILHPEIVLNKRGPKNLQQAYKEMHEFILLPSEDSRLNSVVLRIKPQWKATWDSQEPMMHHLILTKKFKKEQGKIYRLGKEIAIALSKMSDTSIPIDVLPKRFMAYLSFPSDTIFDESGPCDGAYVSIVPRKHCVKLEESSIPGQGESDQYLWISYVSGKNNTNSLLLPLLKEKVDHFLTLGKFIDFDIKQASEEDMKKKQLVNRTIINTLIYLHSKNCELELSKPAAQTNLSNKEILRRGWIVNECTLPVTFVYRNYHGIHYTKDKTVVKAHPRWQRCGQDLSEVKLIFIDSHERHFKNEN